METLIQILRRFEGWGIALRHKFQGDLFLRTTLYVVALQAGLVVVSIIAFLWVLHYTNEKIIATVISHLLSAPSPSAAAFYTVLPQSIDVIQQASVRYVFAGVVVVALLFGVLLAYVTLRPARNSLAYQKLFISNVAHELRTPLSTIKTSTEVALLDPSLSAGVRRVFADTLEELDRLSDIINNLLSLNQFLRPERMEFNAVDLGPIIDTTTKRVMPLARQQSIELQVKKNEYRSVWGNAVALEQMLTNLVKNAVNYTPKGRHGVVVVSVGPDYQGSVTLTVADRGIGIAQKDLFHIFEPFYRADISRTRRVRREGSGLGLAIVNEIVRAHRGKINIQSATGKGTTVSITLPAGATPAGEAPHATAEQEMFNEVSVDFSKGV